METKPDTVTRRFELREFASDRFVEAANPSHRRRRYAKIRDHLHLRQHSTLASRADSVPQALPRTENDVSKRPNRQSHRSLTPTNSHSLKHLPLAAGLEAQHLLPLSDLRRTAHYTLGQPTFHQVASLRRRRRQKCTAYRSRQRPLQ